MRVWQVFFFVVCLGYAKSADQNTLETVITDANEAGKDTTPPNFWIYSSVVEEHGRLRVDGSQIVDKTGKPVRLRGMSLFWSQWKSQFWNSNIVEWLQSDFHATLVRAPMGIEMGGYLENPAKEKEHLETVVKACIHAGIYVIIDWHDHHASMHVEESKLFFNEMAHKYGHYPNVMFEIWNEPMQQDWANEIKPYHETIVPVIRKHTENLIILGTREWSQDVDEAASNQVVGVNLAYTIHFYAATHKQPVRDKVNRALSLGVAVFATEWGTCEASGDGQLGLSETKIWLELLQQHHISDANWAISDKNEACSALRDGASSVGGWEPTQLTASGTFVRASLRESLPVLPTQTTTMMPSTFSLIQLSWIIGGFVISIMAIVSLIIAVCYKRHSATAVKEEESVRSLPKSSSTQSLKPVLSNPSLKSVSSNHSLKPVSSKQILLDEENPASCSRRASSMEHFD